jgi:undecaprenyl-diphosphatase
MLLTPRGHDFDLATYHAIHDTYRAPWLDGAMKFATKMGETKTGLFGLVAFGFFGTPAAQLTTKLAVVALGGSAAIVGLTKYLTDRERPEGISPRKNSSFPSDHASGAAAVAVLISRRHPRLGPIAWLLALWIALSRIYLGRHFPTDVLTGMLLGSIAAWLVLRGEKFFEKLHF